MSDDTLYEYKNDDGDDRKWRELGLRQRGAASLREDRPDMFYPIFVDPKTGNVSLEKKSPFTEEVVPKKADGRESRWSWGRQKVANESDRVYGRLVSGREEYDIFYKDYLDREDGQRTAKPKSIWDDKAVNTESGGKLLVQILGEKVFDYPKPIGLLDFVIRIGSNPGDIILDSFAGSGTTAHAVLSLNKEDGGGRKFILVEGESYADGVTAERIRRVIKGISKAKDEALKNGIGGSFAFCILGQEINIDSLLKGDDLPDYEALARYVFYTATGKTLEKVSKPAADWFIGETGMYNVHLIYKPDVEFLRGNDSALNADLVTKIQARGKGKKSLVFATAKFMGQKELSAANIDFCQLPYAIHRILGE